MDNVLLNNDSMNEKEKEELAVAMACNVLAISTTILAEREKDVDYYEDERRNLEFLMGRPCLGSKAARDLYLSRLYYGKDRICREQLRLSKNSFNTLCSKLREGGLDDTVHVSVEEVVAMFLYIIGHNLKIRKVSFDFNRSGATVSHYFSVVLRAVLRLGKELLVQPREVVEDFEVEKWRWFEDCLGALDGTHVPVVVPTQDQGRYRNRKDFTSTNVLGVCSKDLKFSYVLPGWEGAAADSRVLRNSLTRRDHLIVPNGKYFLVDAGYMNCPGFLAPYRGVRYHLNEWSSRGNRPQTFRELFNLRHSVARNVIERAFGVLKKRWSILRSTSFYNAETHVKIINACVILHNHIRNEEPEDPLLDELDQELGARVPEQDLTGVDDGDEMDVEEVDVNIVNSDRVINIQATREWSQWRDDLANAMFVEYQNRGRNI